MALTDPLGDMLTRIRNGQQAKKDTVLSPASTLRSLENPWRANRASAAASSSR